MVISSGEVDTELIESIFAKIRDFLASNDQEGLRTCTTQLDEASTPTVTLEILAPHLFREEAPGALISSEDALSVLGFLVQVDSTRYLKPASRAVKNEAVRLTGVTGLPISVSPALQTVMISQLSGSDVEVSSNATEAIVACCRKLGNPFAESVLRAIAAAWKASWDNTVNNRAEATTICVRCASAIVEIMLLGDITMQAAVSCGASDVMTAMMDDESDPLLAMTVLDLIEKLAVSLPMHHERARWLFSPSIIQRVLKLAGGVADEEPDAILGGPALRLVAALCKLRQLDADAFGLDDEYVLNGFHRALRHYQSSAELDRLAVVDAISSFASASTEALDLVLSDPMTREAWLSLSVAQPKLKSAILFSVSTVLEPPPRVDTNGDSLQVNKPSSAAGVRLYASLGQTNNRNPTELVLSAAKSQLPEIRLGAYALLRAVAMLPTGGQLLFSSSDFFGFLIDQERDSTKEGREAKYAIVQAVIDSPVKGLLADDIVRQLEKFIEQGPHYSLPRSWDVMTE